MAVCQMNAGQQSLIRCCSDYGFSSTRRPASVPIDAPLFFLVRVLRWEKEKNLHEMSLADKFEYCDRRRQCGKDLFAGGKPLSAARQYDKAITALESVRNHEVEMKTVQQKNELITLFLVNQAQSEQKTPSHIGHAHGRASNIRIESALSSPAHPSLSPLLFAQVLHESEGLQRRARPHQQGQPPG